jgi:hypothetical protein
MPEGCLSKDSLIEFITKQRFEPETSRILKRSATLNWDDIIYIYNYVNDLGNLRINFSSTSAILTI